MDPLFVSAQYEAMFTALNLARKNAKLMRYWGEGHGPSSPANIRDMWKNIDSWFDTHLKIHRDANGNLAWNDSELQ
jgi:dipeptidyl aminopeptidase/acylaminoacyl peptidase